MRHYYKSHGKHCYLRSFQSECPRCNANILYWECTHGCKVFFEYPPYGKLIRHICRHREGPFNQKTKDSIIVKKPKGLLEERSLSCPICGKLFKNVNSLDDHVESLKRNDIYHKLFLINRISFEEHSKENFKKNNFKPKFGKINIKTQKKID